MHTSSIYTRITHSNRGLEVMDEEVSSGKEGETQSSELAADGVRWRPSHFLFCPYSPSIDTDVNPQHLRVVVRRPVSVFASHLRSLFGFPFSNFYLCMLNYGQNCSLPLGFFA